MPNSPPKTPHRKFDFLPTPPHGQQRGLGGGVQEHGRKAGVPSIECHEHTRKFMRGRRCRQCLWWWEEGDAPGQVGMVVGRPDSRSSSSRSFCEGEKGRTWEAGLAASCLGRGLLGIPEGKKRCFFLPGLTKTDPQGYLCYPACHPEELALIF